MTTIRWTLSLRDSAVLAACALIIAFLLSNYAVQGPMLRLTMPDVLMVFGTTLLSIVVGSQFAPSAARSRLLVLALTALIGVCVGCAVTLGVAGIAAAWQQRRLALLTMPAAFVDVALLGVTIKLLMERDAAARNALHELQKRQSELKQQMAEVRMQMLKSQVEPHFLFNTLSHVRRLYAVAPEQGRHMTRELARYIGDVHSALRGDRIPLSDDIELARAYLNLQQVRMGTRLRFQLSVVPQARQLEVPPVAMTTLVENAIKHGLSPKPDGGEVNVHCTVEGSVAVLRVSDTGVGLQATFGSGVGLANLRARLANMYGPAASLSLQRNEPHGVVVLVRIPLRPPGGTRE